MQQANKQTAVSNQRLGKHVPTETNMHTTTEEWCFGCGPRQGAIKKANGAIQPIEGWQLRVQFCKEDRIEGAIV
jgi:hypothetical protein